MKICVNGEYVSRLPQLTLEERLVVARKNMVKFGRDKHGLFWKNVYIQVRNALEKEKEKRTGIHFSEVKTVQTAN